MRCPKCSFISFDYQETCVKCGKNINAAAEELHGTVYSAESPPFLKFVFEDSAEEETAAESAEFETEEEFDLGGDEDEAFVDLGGEDESGAESVDMDITAEEVVAEPEDEAATEEALDMADLAPAEEEAEAPSEEFEAVVEETASESAEQAGQGLEDLKVEGIDLDASATASTEKGKTMPSVKTGTALDDFDIDLGDLLPKK